MFTQSAGEATKETTTQDGISSVNRGLSDNNTLQSKVHKHNAPNYKELSKWKLYGRQFLSMDVMFDALFLLSKHDSDYKLRVPISALIDYKGFRCLAIG